MSEGSGREPLSRGEGDHDTSASDVELGEAPTMEQPGGVAVPVADVALGEAPTMERTGGASVSAADVALGEAPTMERPEGAAPSSTARSEKPTGERAKRGAALPSPTALGEASTFLGMGEGLGPENTPRSVADRVERARVLGALFDHGATPETLGRYVLVDTLGAGAMGTVLRAFDRELNRTVAIKVLHEHLDERHTARLRREAQALAKLSHPNVVQVYEVAEVEGRTFVAMELVEGQTVREWVAQTKPGWRACVEMFIQLGDGLTAAHESGLVHRDFKPGNAVVDDKGRPRVLDFGLARQGDEAEPVKLPSIIEKASTEPIELGPLEQSLTRTGSVLGTPAYMPPEQVHGEVADARSDQFSFCVSLYEALYGERPYEGSTLQALMVSIVSGTIRSAPRGSAVPAGVRTILLQGLAARPGERWPSMEVLLEHLRRQVAPSRGWRWVTGVGALAAVAAVIAVRQTQTVSEQGVEITQTKEQLAARVEELQEERDKVAVQLAAQKGLRATMLAEDPGHEVEAVRVAVEAAGGIHAETGSIPAAVFEGLTHALAGVHGGLALRGHTSVVQGVAVSPDGQHIATASEDATVRLWDSHSGAPLQTLEGHQVKVWAVAFSPDGMWMATGSEDKTVRLWDRTTGQELDAWTHPHPVRSVAVSPDGQRIALASENAAWVWHPGADDVAVPLVGHTGRVRDVAFSPKGEQLVTASEDGTVQLWDVKTAQAIKTFDGHTDKVLAVTFSPDGTRIASGGRDQTVRLWNATTRQPQATLEAGDVVYSVAFSPDGTQLATSTFDDGTARLWDVATGRPVDVFHHDETVFDVAFSPDGQRLVTASRDFTAHAWDLDPGKALEILKHDRRVDAVALSPDGTRMATGSGDGSTRLWEADSGALLATMQGHTLDVLDVTFSPDGQRLASASWDGSVRVWKASSGTLVQTLIEHTEPVRTVVFSPDGTRVVTASRDGTAWVWDVATGARHHTLPHGSPLVDAVLSPDGNRLVTVGVDDMAKVWSMATGEALAGLPAEGPVTAVAFSPDGTRIAAARKDNEVRAWSIIKGETLATFAGHSALVTEIVFSANGAQLATASEDGTARVWNASTGTQRATLPHHGPVSHVAFSADGQRLATASGDAQAWVWSLQAEAWLPWGCAVLTDRQGHNEATQKACATAATREAPSERAPRTQPEPVLVVPEPARHTPETKTVHGVELVLIPGGTFTMGSPSGEAGRQGDEGPQHEVTLDSFYLAKTELTNAQYALYREANPEVPEPPGWEPQHQERYGQPDQPVMGLTWYEAKAYCDWAGFVLPTEAQWEYAARAGTTSPYWFGDEPEELPRFGWLYVNTGARERGQDGARPHAVATKGANAFGLYDIHGNMWEWTFDTYEPYTTSVRAGDGLGKQPVGDADRIIRGGSWNSDVRFARAAYRVDFDPGGQTSNIGFRPAQGIP